MLAFQLFTADPCPAVDFRHYQIDTAVVTIDTACFH